MSDASAKLPPRQAERQAIWVLLVSCICLTLLDYGCDRAWVSATLGQWPNTGWRAAFIDCCVSPRQPLGRSLYWVGVNLACYLILPYLTIRLILRRPLAEFGLRWDGAFKLWPIYGLMLLIMLPLVAWISGSSSFLASYPFLRLPAGAPLWPTFLWWELLYFCQFFALEFFFRGFLLHGIAPHCGRISVLIMTVPYCMLHFGKPMPETLAAIVAGVVLGSLSLHSRSIIMGAIMHCSVALAMDGFALWRKGLLPGLN